MWQQSLKESFLTTTNTGITDDDCFYLHRRRQGKSRGALQRSGSLGDEDECEDTDEDDDEVPTLLRSLSSDHDDDNRDEPLDIDSGKQANYFFMQVGHGVITFIYAFYLHIYGFYLYICGFYLIVFICL